MRKSKTIAVIITSIVMICGLALAVWLMQYQAFQATSRAKEEPTAAIAVSCNEINFRIDNRDNSAPASGRIRVQTGDGIDLTADNPHDYTFAIPPNNYLKRTLHIALVGNNVGGISWIEWQQPFVGKGHETSWGYLQCSETKATSISGTVSVDFEPESVHITVQRLNGQEIGDFVGRYEATKDPNNINNYRYTILGLSDPSYVVFAEATKTGITYINEPSCARSLPNPPHQCIVLRGYEQSFDIKKTPYLLP